MKYGNRPVEWRMKKRTILGAMSTVAILATVAGIAMIDRTCFPSATEGR